MRSGREVRVSDSQCQSRNFPGFDPRGAADEAVLNKVLKKSQNPPFFEKYCGFGSGHIPNVYVHLYRIELWHYNTLHGKFFLNFLILELFKLLPHYFSLT
jgi:hypothetical protein